MTRAERSARNKRAHAIRRALIDQDAREARAAGLELTWRAVADTYAAMSTDTVLETFGDVLPAASSTPAAAVPASSDSSSRQAPAHIRAAQTEYRAARDAWEAGLEEAIAGGRSTAAGGRPARGERYTDEERDYRAAHPAPVWKDYLRAMRAPSSVTA